MLAATFISVQDHGQCAGFLGDIIDDYWTVVRDLSKKEYLY